MRWTIGAAALLCTGLCSAGELRVQRTEGAVSTIIDGAPQAAGKQTPLDTGNRLQTGAGARADLQVNGGGSILVGIDSRVLVEGSSPPDPPARAALVRLRLETGALRIDARKQAKSDAADIRLQLPFLSMRIYGAEAFVQAGPEGDEVCVLSGAIEVKTPRADERIDRPRECLRWTELGRLHFEPDRRDNLAADMLQTSFSDDHQARYAVMQEMERARERAAAKEARAAGGIPPVAVAAAAPVVAPPVAAQAAPSGGSPSIPANATALPTPVVPPSAPAEPDTHSAPIATTPSTPTAVVAAATPEPPSAALPASALPDASANAIPTHPPDSAETPAPTTATSPPPVAPEAPPALTPPGPAAAGGLAAPSPEWHIVLSTFSLADTAQRAVRVLASRHPNLQVRETTALGRTYYRVMTAPFATLSEANIALERLRRDPDFAKAWILPPQ